MSQPAVANLPRPDVGLPLASVASAVLAAEVTVHRRQGNTEAAIVKGRPLQEKPAGL